MRVEIPEPYTNGVEGYRTTIKSRNLVAFRRVLTVLIPDPDLIVIPRPLGIEQEGFVTKYILELWHW